MQGETLGRYRGPGTRLDGCGRGNGCTRREARKALGRGIRWDRGEVIEKGGCMEGHNVT